MGSSIFTELRNVVFANVNQFATRNIATDSFRQLLSLDHAFHLSRQTGALSRSIQRGTKGIQFILTSTLFHIAPTLFEIIMVSGILVNLTS